MAKTAKDEMMELMVEVFGMIEALDIQEGKYLEFAELFKRMNLNINRLSQMKQIIVQNVYYHRYIKRNTTLKRKRLTQAQKAVNPDYLLCDCGDYIHNDELLNHLKTLKHQTGLRNRKYSSKKGDVDINFEINREVLLQGFCIRHQQRKFNADIDTDNDINDV